MNNRNKLSLPRQASIEGLEHIRPKMNDMQAAILALLKRRGFYGATDSEIADELRIGDNARKRRGELCKQGLVSPSGRKRLTVRDGREVGPTRQTVWVARDFVPGNAVKGKDIDSLERSLSSLARASRKLLRTVRLPEPSPDEIRSQYDAIVSTYEDVVAKYHTAWISTLSLVTCDVCEGHGEREYWRDTTDHKFEHTTEHWVAECDECDGKGYTDAD